MLDHAASWFFVMRLGMLCRVVINHTGPVPIWRQVAGILRQRIHNGTYPPDTAIPSLVKLTEEFGIAEVTVRKAVDALKAEGLLAGTPGKGTYVVPQDR
jgi:DNA-binding GntR family transcriptional regulator